MFRFANPTYLWLLLLIPILAVIYHVWVYQCKKRMARFGDKTLLKQLTPGYSKWRPLLKFYIMEVILALLIIVIARPQVGTKISKDKREGIEAMIAMDISNSMLAQDVAPTRLDRSKRLVEDLVNRFTNDKIGIVVFAGDAFVQLPITSDYISAKMFLNNISPELIGSQGTDIGKAIELSEHSFSEKANFGKAIIIITDGENHEKGAEEMAREAQKQGIRVFILGIGSPQGAPIPMGNGSYLQDTSGQTVMTRLNEDMCRKIAEAGKGMYIHVDNTTAAETILDNEIGKMQRGEIESVSYSDCAEQFQAIAVLALVLLIVEALLMERKNPWYSRFHLFTKKQ